MIFRQLFDNVSSTYTYLMANRRGAEALIIDPVYERVEHYLRLLGELDLKLAKAVDTHVHADHITGASMLRDRFGSQTVISEAGQALCADRPVNHGDEIRFGMQLMIVDEITEFDTIIAIDEDGGEMELTENEIDIY